MPCCFIEKLIDIPHNISFFLLDPFPRRNEVFRVLSIPIKLRPVFTQATPVDPLPMQLSSTVSPGSVYVRISHSHSATGFSVG